MEKKEGNDVYENIIHETPITKNNVSLDIIQVPEATNGALQHKIKSDISSKIASLLI